MSTAVRLITAEELFHLPAVDSQRCELIDGEIVPMTPPGGLHGYIGGQLVGRLFAYVQAHRLGAVVLAETGFVVSRNPDTVLAPDGAFIKQDRLIASGVPRAYFSEAPALVIEVVSPNDTVAEVAEKMRRWLQAGVELAWVVDPIGRTVTVYRSTDDIRILTEKGVLTGDDVVPGFECRVAELFADL